MIAAARALDQRFVKAMSAGDVDGMVALYWDSPDVVSFPPDVMEARGIPAIREALAKTAEGMKGGTLELYDDRYSVAGEVVLTTGRWRFTMELPGGAPPMVVEGRYTDAKAERGGKWVYLWDHASVPVSPPQDPAAAPAPEAPAASTP
jgi:ketosteroid isomerase-like protein